MSLFVFADPMNDERHPSIPNPPELVKHKTLFGVSK